MLEGLRFSIALHDSDAEQGLRSRGGPTTTPAEHATRYRSTSIAFSRYNTLTVKTAISFRVRFLGGKVSVTCPVCRFRQQRGRPLLCCFIGLHTVSMMMICAGVHHIVSRSTDYHVSFGISRSDSIQSAKQSDRRLLVAAEHRHDLTGTIQFRSRMRKNMVFDGECAVPSASV